jgi:hypothetical protein
MARPTDTEAEPRRQITAQIEIGMRAYNEAIRATDPGAKSHLFDFAISHFATAAAKVAEQKRKSQ